MKPMYKVIYKTGENRIKEICHMELQNAVKQATVIYKNMKKEVTIQKLVKGVWQFHLALNSVN